MEELVVISFEAVAQAARAAEHAEGGHGRRVVRVFCEGAAPELWHGVFGSAPVESGAAAGFQFSDGERVAL